MVAILTAPPMAEPVTRDEAKAHARIDGTAEDAKVDALIVAARMEVENRTGRALVTQKWRIVRDRVPPDGVMRLAPGPVRTVDAVTVYGDDGMPQRLSAVAYQADTASSPGRLRLSGALGGRAMNGVEVDLTCGYGEPHAVPAPLKQAVLMLVAHWFEEREAASVGAVTGAVAAAVAALTAPYRISRLV